MKIILMICLIIVLAFLAAGFMLFRMVFDNKMTFPEGDGEESNSLLEPTGAKLNTFNDAKKEEYNKNSFQQMRITSFDGLKLVGDFLEGTNPKETVILVHGYRSSPEGDFCAIIDIYRERGCNILLVHDRAHGKSEGRYIGFSEPDRFDVQKWCEEIASLYPETSIYLHGMSMGAATVLHASNMELPPQVKGIISDCGFNSILEVSKHLMKTQFHIPYMPIGYIAAGFAKMIAGISFNKSQSVISVEQTNLPILFIAGTKDCYVPVETTKRMYEHCHARHDILLVDGAGHAASYMMAQEAYTKKVNAFINES